MTIFEAISLLKPRISRKLAKSSTSAPNFQQFDHSPKILPGLHPELRPIFFQTDGMLGHIFVLYSKIE